MNKPNILTRRSFLGKSACSAMAAGGVANTLLHLRGIQAATTVNPADDYKALVCLYLHGGNDSDSMIVPTSAADYTVYNDTRQHLAVPNAGELNGLMPLSPATADVYGRTFGVNPSVPEIPSLFNAGNLAVIANVGTLVRPVTRAEYLNGVDLPPQLFSHSDQTLLWQNSVPTLANSTGWGGRLADLVNSANGNNELSMSISIDGTNTFQVGNDVSQYHVSTNGSISLTDYVGEEVTGWSAPVRSRALDDIYNIAHNNLMANQYKDVMARAVRNDKLISEALANSASSLTTTFPDTGIGRQLQMIAKLIATRSVLGLKRQIFFCGVGGFDTHGDNLVAYNNNLIPAIQALNAFYEATSELGVQDQVTSFTASEFGRTYTHNGVGTDHAWGAAHLVVGGCVAGGDIYGTMPRYELGGPDDTYSGSWIPGQSVDQYSATLAKWFGVSDTDMPTVFPNLGAFSTPDLGFMN